MDAILGFLNSNVVLFGFVIGLIVKYWPKAKWVPNSLIPFLVGFVAWLSQAFGPAEAHASLGIFKVAGGFFAPIIAAGWDAVKSALIYEVFARNPLDRLGIKKA